MLEEPQIETTIYSMSAKAPRKGNRRSDERHLTIFRVGSIIIGERRELCLVKNISAGGTLIRAYSALKPKQKLEVELKEGQPLAGKVSWVRGVDAGIEFDALVDIVDILKSSEDEPRPRMPRIELKCMAFVREGAISNRARVHNISQGGVSIETSSPLSAGAEVTVSLPGLAPQGGTVRWNEGDRYGISFNAVLPLASLVEWLQARDVAA